MNTAVDIKTPIDSDVLRTQDVRDTQPKVESVGDSQPRQDSIRDSGISQDNSKDSNIRQDNSKDSNIRQDNSKDSNIRQDNSKDSNIRQDNSKDSLLELPVNLIITEKEVTGTVNDNKAETTTGYIRCATQDQRIPDIIICDEIASGPGIRDVGPDSLINQDGKVLRIMSDPLHRGSESDSGKESCDDSPQEDACSSRNAKDNTNIDVETIEDIPDPATETSNNKSKLNNRLEKKKKSKELIENGHRISCHKSHHRHRHAH